MSITLKAKVRTDLGKGASRRLRREAGMIPAIMFGGAKNKKPVSLTLEHKEVFKASESSSFYSSVLTIDVEGKEESVILKDMQRHPAKQEIMHVDFQRVTKSNPISILVPIKFLNETTCPAVKIGGGRISHQMSEVVITCLAADIPEFVAIDMQEIEIGQIVHLSDIDLPKGVKIQSLSTGAKNDTPVANISAKKGG